MKHLILVSFLVLGSMISSTQAYSTVPEQVIGKKNLQLTSDKMTPEVLWSFGRLGDVQVSPDGKTLLYGVSYFSKEEDKGNRDLYTISMDGSSKKQLTKTPESEYGAIWQTDGKKILYLSSKSGKSQIWSSNPDGSEAKQISYEDGNITNISFSPKGDKLFFTMDVKVTKNVHDLYSDLPKANALLLDDLLYRHWDNWEDTYFSHIFVANYAEGIVSDSKDIMPNEPYDTPLMPFGGIEEITWSPSGNQIAYTCKKQFGKEYALSTNSDIYIYDLETGATRNLTKGMMGYDRSPLYSPDGKKLAWLSMERAGFEADKDRLFIYDFETKSMEDYSKEFDYSPSSMNWTPNGKEIIFVCGINATFQVYRLTLKNKKFEAITKGDHDYHSVALAGDYLVGTKVSMSKPAEIYKIDPKTGKETEISFENKEILSQLEMGKVEKRWITTTDNKKMLTWIIYPPHFDASKKYPTILYCEGGPQSPLSQFWSYRWNFQMMAANDYIIVAPNRRGVLTFGQDWTDAVSKDNGGQCMDDYLSAIDELKKEPYIDGDRLGAVGASFGGFSVYWLAGHHQHRFKAFIAHCGVFNSEMEYATTDEMFFDNWEKGGAFWDLDNKVAQKSFASSPHKFVQNWDTPILVIHGGKDFRIPYTQGMAAFNSAQLQGIPSRFLYFPEESHWVLHPQNGILWQRVFFGWLDKYLK
ncbi:S9 family peptidase [Ancylomarina longa]|uniref:S9 family peptidase n=1 Tax=Ancylomarina longa TaxID=2487017 RepID=A0A434AVX5_9BACT|nr:S9 family peptidase [Ancylomarina longa]RUT78524.1 S9 family peptidase [Ancylomarina longa]